MLQIQHHTICTYLTFGVCSGVGHHFFFFLKLTHQNLRDHLLIGIFGDHLLIEKETDRTTI